MEMSEYLFMINSIRVSNFQMVKLIIRMQDKMSCKQLTYAAQQIKRYPFYILY